MYLIIIPTFDVFKNNLRRSSLHFSFLKKVSSKTVFYASFLCGYHFVQYGGYLHFLQLFVFLSSLCFLFVLYFEFNVFSKDFIVFVL